MLRKIILLLCLSPVMSFAGSYEFDISAGGRHPRAFDPTLSPVVYFGAAADLDAGFEYRDGEAALTADLGIGGGLLSSGKVHLSQSGNRIVDTVFDFGLSAGGFWLAASGGGSELRFGAVLEYDFIFINLVHLGRYSWSGDLSIGPSAEYRLFPSENSSIRLSFSTAVFSMLNRPGWTIFDDELDSILAGSFILLLFRGTPVFITDYLKLDGKIEYEYIFDLNRSALFSASCGYRSVKIPRPALFIDFEFRIGFRYAW